MHRSRCALPIQPPSRNALSSSPSDSVRPRTVASGVALVASSRAIRHAAMMIMMAIAARWLGQQAVGVWALIYLVVQFGVLVGDCGISTFIVRHKILDDRLFGTAFTLAIALALPVSFIVAAAGVPIAAWMGMSEYVLHFVVSAFAIVPQVTHGMFQSRLRRDCRFRVMLVTEATGSAVMLGSSVWMLINGFGLWSFVIPTIVAPVVSAAMGIYAVGFPPLGFSKHAIKEILDYASGLLGFATVNYWARNADHALIGRFLGAAPLGVYALAYRIMMMPLSQITVTAHTVALPYMAPHQGNAEKLNQLMRNVIILVGMVTTLPMTWIWLEREFLVDLVLGKEWSETADLLVVFAPLAVLQALVNPIGLCFHVSGKTKTLFAVGIVNTLVMLISFALGVATGSLIGFACCYLVANVIMAPVMVTTGMRTIGGTFFSWFKWCLPFFAVMGGSWIIHSLRHSLESPSANALMTVVITCLVMLPVYAAILSRMGGTVFLWKPTSGVAGPPEARKGV